MARSEFALIDAFRALLPLRGPRVLVGSGDDAAVVRAGSAHAVTSIDTTVDGVHARLDLGDPQESARAFGWRALTTALSDLAACGAPAGEAYVALTAPRDAPDAQLLAIIDGLGEAAARYGVVIAGGDVTSGPGISISVTVVGWPEHPPLRRAGVRAGDLIGLSGPIGAAGAGLAVRLGQVDAGAHDAALLAAHLRPIPELELGTSLATLGAHAAIDLSDGLHADAEHLAVASELRLDLWPESIPLAEGVAEVASALGHADPLAFAAGAGEDFALLVAVPPALRASAEAAGLTHWIGEARALAPGEVPGASGLPPAGGFDHRT